MSKAPETPVLIPTERADLFFEDNTVGRCKKEVWDSTDEEIDAILAEYGVPSPCEWAKAGSYVQTTVRQQVVEEGESRLVQEQARVLLRAIMVSALC